MDHANVDSRDGPRNDATGCMPGVEVFHVLGLLAQDREAEALAAARGILAAHRSRLSPERRGYY